MDVGIIDGAHYANKCPLKIDPPKENWIFVVTRLGKTRGKATPIQILGKCFDKYFKFLIDCGAIDSFISNSLVKNVSKVPKVLKNGWQVEFRSCQKYPIRQCFRDVEIELPKVYVVWNLYVVPLASYNIILSMKWLMSHKDIIEF